MRTCLLRGSVALLVLGFAGSALADDLADVENKIDAAWGKLRSLTGKMSMKSDMSAESFKMTSDSSGTYEFMRKGDKMLYRMEMKTVASSNMAGTETKTESNTLTISDGDYDYSLSETNGQKNATKSKANKEVMDPKSWMATQKQMFNMKLMPDEKIEGYDCWVIEATPKSEEQAMAGKSVWYYAKDLGMPLKFVGFGPDGKQNTTMSYSDIKINEDINPDRFVFKAPDGVKVEEIGAAPSMPEPTPPADNP